MMTDVFLILMDHAKRNTHIKFICLKIKRAIVQLVTLSNRVFTSLEWQCYSGNNLNRVCFYMPETNKVILQTFCIQFQDSSQIFTYLKDH